VQQHKALLSRSEITKMQMICVAIDTLHAISLERFVLLSLSLSRSNDGWERQ
jgi:hypothetical protein